MTTKPTLPTLFEWTGTCRNVNLPKSLRQIFSWSTWRFLLPCCESMSERNVCYLFVVLECFEVVWLWRPLMTTKTTLPTLFEWTGTCRNVNLPKSLRQIFSLSTWRRACCLVVSKGPREMCVACLLFWNVLEWFDCEGRWWQQKQPYLLCSSGLALAGTWTYQKVWGKSFLWRLVDVLVALLWVYVWGKCVLPVCCFGMFWRIFEVVWLWRPLMTTKTTLPTLFEWTGTCRNVNLPKRLRQIFSLNTWRRACCLVVRYMFERNMCCLFVVLECFGDFWSGLIVKAVDDNKTNLTYFVRVDRHLPERELTKKSEANLLLEHLKIPVALLWVLSMSERNVCYLFVVLEWFDCEGRWWQQNQPYLLCSSGLALAGTWTYQKDWGKSWCWTLGDVLRSALQFWKGWRSEKVLQDTALVWRYHLFLSLRNLQKSVWSGCNPLLAFGDTSLASLLDCRMIRTQPSSKGTRPLRKQSKQTLAKVPRFAVWRAEI